jgi:hypothetical protein
MRRIPRGGPQLQRLPGCERPSLIRAGKHMMLTAFCVYTLGTFMQQAVRAVLAQNPDFSAQKHVA